MGAASSIAADVQLAPARELISDGVLLSEIDNFIVLCGGRGKLEGLTTTEVCEMHVKRLTNDSQLSFCEKLRVENHHAVGPPKVFISHAWKYLFLDVVNALKYHLRESLDIYVWFDLFSNNQHKAIALDFTWWSETFKTAIQQLGKTIMVFSPWHNSIPLTRAWCIFEMYATAATSSVFEIAMLPSDQNDFMDSLLEDAGETLDRIADSINTEKSQCFKEEDRVRIFEAVRSIGGFHVINKLVFDQLRDWVVRTTKTHLEEAKSSNDFDQEIKLVNALEELYRKQGLYLESSKLLEMYLDDSRVKNVGEDVVVLKMKTSLASCYATDKKFQNACTLLNDVLSRQEEILSNNHKDIINTLSELADVHEDMLDYTNAETFLYRALPMAILIHGKASTETWKIMDQLSGVYEHQAKYQEAEEQYLEVIDMKEAKLSDPSSGLKSEDIIVLKKSIIGTKNNLASLYDNLEKYDKAEELFSICFETNKVLLGPYHPDSKLACYNLAVVLDNVGKKERSYELYNEAYRLSETSLGELHPETLKNLACLASFEVDNPDTTIAKKGMDRLEECLRKCRQVFGEFHQETLAILQCIASVNVDTDKDVLGRTQLIECLQLRRKHLGETHTDTLKSLNSLASYYDDKEEYVLAEPLYEECLRNRRKLLGPHDPDLLDTIGNLATCYDNQHKYVEAEKLFQECYTKHKEVNGMDYSSTIMHMYNLGIVCANLEKHSIAISYFEECFAKQEKTLGLDDKDTQATVDGLVDSYEALGDDAMVNKWRAKQIELAGSDDEG